MSKQTFPLRKREEGGEQPYFPLGPFKIRLPLVHYKWAWTEFLAALFLGVACLGAGTAITIDVLGVDSFEIALTFAVVNAIMYAVPAHFGDPVVPGWITPALPLTIAYLSDFAIGPERIHAMIALQLVVALLFFIMGMTGLGAKLVNIIPISVRGGIILGAGFAAALNVINDRIPQGPVTLTISVIIAFFFLFSKVLTKLAERDSRFKILKGLGIVPPQLFAIFAGPFLIRELPIPEIEWGFTPLNFGHVFENYTVFGIGVPDANLFVLAIPMALMAYVIAFGDMILGQDIVRESREKRPDETIEINTNRSNLVNGIRNGLMALFTPWVPMNGPLWAAGLVPITERYKMGKKTMDSIWDGLGTFRAATVIAVMLMPLVTLIKPAFDIFFGITMAVQVVVCGNIGMRLLQTNEQRSVAIVMAGIIAIVGPAQGLISGVILYFIIEYGGKFEKEDAALAEGIDEEDEENEEK
ncbi:solute carrier family 23 protein [Natranaerofaba carboxydovora]|uniref:solute carrier family 23 protein n=1 Tax=Natranaerofaba carboxydovora TaxID=2742683 RepID=UPI001F137096|nr:solute carrier family 23 protein [Natranaerofaba carboxydovora]UMZ73762.1 hypothetical protein ACONDI_01331 [Natranaerofaba carboxydovora]